MDLHFEEHGNKDGAIMLFLHGGGVGSWMWDQQIKHFTEYHCFTVDLPEQGENKGSGLFSIADSARKINALLEKLKNGKKVIVIGFSLGAQVAIQMLSEQRTLIDYAMINSALVRPMPYLKKLIKPAVSLTHPLTSNRTFAKLQAKTLHIGEGYFEQYYQASSEMSSETLSRILIENMTFSIPLSFNNTKAKVLVTVGELEKAVMHKSAQDIALGCSNSQCAIVSGVGHGAPIAAASTFNNMLEDWLRN